MQKIEDKEIIEDVDIGGVVIPKLIFTTSYVFMCFALNSDFSEDEAMELFNQMIKARDNIAVIVNNQINLVYKGKNKKPLSYSIIKICLSPDSLLHRYKNAVRPKIKNNKDLKMLDYVISELQDSDNGYTEVILKTKIIVKSIFEVQQKRKTLERKQVELSTCGSYQEGWCKKRFLGISGSGKTMTLIQKAINCVTLKPNQSNKKVLFLTYTAVLNLNIRNLLSSYGDVYVTYYSDLISKVYHDKDYYSTIIEMDEFNENEWEKYTTKAIIEKKITIKQKYSSVLIDEAQDFKEEQIQCASFFLDDNADYKDVLIAADPMQNIFSNTHLDEEPELLIDGGYKKYPSIKGFDIRGKWPTLNISYRSDSPLTNIFMDYSNEFLSEYFSSSKKDDTSSPQMELFQSNANDDNCNDLYFTYTSLPKHNIISTISSKVRELTELDHVPLSDIVILTCSKDYSDYLRDITNEIKGTIGNNLVLSTYFVKDASTEKKQTIRETFGQFDGKIRISSIQSFKGLESDTVILLLDGRNIINAKNELIYVGITRAKRQLIIVSNQDNEENISEICRFFYKKQKFNCDEYVKLFLNRITKILLYNKKNFDKINLCLASENFNAEYDSTINRLYYLSRYVSKYVNEYLNIFKYLCTCKDFVSSEEKRILSIGCGAGVDLIGIKEAFGTCNIIYHGIDYADWSRWDDDINVPDSLSRRMVVNVPEVECSFSFGEQAGNVFSFLEKENNYEFDIIHFPASYREIVGKNEELEKTLWEKMKNIVKKKTAIIISNPSIRENDCPYKKEIIERNVTIISENKVEIDFENEKMVNYDTSEERELERELKAILDPRELYRAPLRSDSESSVVFSAYILFVEQ